MQTNRTKRKQSKRIKFSLYNQAKKSKEKKTSYNKKKKTEIERDKHREHWANIFIKIWIIIIIHAPRTAKLVKAKAEIKISRKEKLYIVSNWSEKNRDFRKTAYNFEIEQCIHCDKYRRKTVIYTNANRISAPNKKNQSKLNKWRVAI